MCRSIKVLRKQTPPATREDISAAALQFVRKVSGYHKPSKANQEAFDAAVGEIAAVTARLLDCLEPTAPREPLKDPVSSAARSRRSPD